MADGIGTFEQAVLLAVIRLDDEAYGRAIVDEVQKRGRHAVAVGAVHATLVRLEDKGMLSSRVAAGTPRRSGRPRRYYKIQPAGVRALRDARQTIANLWRGVRLPLIGEV
jgi:DNA-binding PadR family transcriptional regulator